MQRGANREANELLHQAVLELYAWRGDPVVSAKAALAADPSFVTAKAFVTALDLLGTGTAPATLDGELKALHAMLKAKPAPTPVEQWHVAAVQRLADGDLRVLVDDPTDPIALRYANDALFYLGRAHDIKDVNLAVLPRWQKGSPFYSYALGMTAFGLEESGMYRQAEKYATDALDLCRTDAWATHARAHVYEMEGHFADGEVFLLDTERDWSGAGGLACHNYWHAALYRIELGRHGEALELFDAHMASIAAPAILDLVDMSALLFRLEMEGVNVGKRWQHVWQHWQPHLHDHLTAFNDAHIAMALLGASPVGVDVDKWLETTTEFALHGSGGHKQLSDEVGRAIVAAVARFKQHKYSQAAELLLPVRNDVDRIGGSHAQRDVVHQLLIQACLRSGEPLYVRTARHLLSQRHAARPTSGLTQRLLAWLHDAADEASEDA